MAGLLLGLAVLIGGCSKEPGTCCPPVGPPQQQGGAEKPGQPAGTIEHVGTADFDHRVLRSEAPVLVDFYAEWCGPCKKMAPLLEKLAQENSAVRIVKVNIDEHPELAQRYRINAIPRLIVFENGQIRADETGFRELDDLRVMLNR